MATNHIPTEVPGPDAASLLVAFTRMEAKVDVALAQHGADLKNHGEGLADHETRIRALESTPTVSPRTLWTTVVSAAGLILAILTFIEKIIAG